MIASGQITLLRLPRSADIALLLRWDNDPAFWKYGNREKRRISIDQMRDFVCNRNDFLSHGQLRLMISDQIGKNLGTLDYFNFDKIDNSCEIGILIASEEMRNRGYGADALRSGLEYAFSTFRLSSIKARIPAGNIASTRLFRKAGFSLIRSENGHLYFSYRF